MSRKLGYVGLAVSAVLLASIFVLLSSSVLAVPPSSCSGTCTSAGQTCCWTDTHGAHQNTCQGQDYCPGGCTWGPQADCGSGSTCAGGSGGPGTKCKWTPCRRQQQTAAMIYGFDDSLMGKYKDLGIQVAFACPLDNSLAY